MNEEYKQKIEQWENGLQEIENKHIDFFISVPPLRNDEDFPGIEDFLQTNTNTGRYDIIAVCGHEMPLHIQKEINQLAISIFPQQ
jgi:hypothetical protein